MGVQLLQRETPDHLRGSGVGPRAIAVFRAGALVSICQMGAARHAPRAPARRLQRLEQGDGLADGHARLHTLAQPGDGDYVAF